MRGWLRPDGGYYGGDQEHPLHVEVPARPSPLHIWTGASWYVDPKVEHNWPIDAEIRRIEAANPVKHRALREGLYGTSLLTDLVNARLLALETQMNDKLLAIAQLAGLTTLLTPDGLALLDPIALPKDADERTLPDVKQNKGMQDIKAIDDQVKAERAKRMP